MFWRFGEIFWCFGAMVKCFDLFSKLLQLVPQLRICQSSPSHLELFSDGPAAPNSLSLQDTSLDSMNQVCSYQFHFYIKRKVFLKVGLKSTFHTHTPQPHPLPHPKDSHLLSIFAACAKWWQLRWGGGDGGHILYVAVTGEQVLLWLALSLLCIDRRLSSNNRMCC